MTTKMAAIIQNNHGRLIAESYRSTSTPYSRLRISERSRAGQRGGWVLGCASAPEMTTTKRVGALRRAGDRSRFHDSNVIRVVRTRAVIMVYHLDLVGPPYGGQNHQISDTISALWRRGSIFFIRESSERLARDHQRDLSFSV